MKRLFIGLLVILLILVALSAAALYSLQSGGYLERRLSSLVQHDKYDKFGFASVSPNWDLSFDMHKPRFSRGELIVTADKITILPKYDTLHTARPVAEKFIVHNASVVWPAARLSGLTIKGTCPKATDALRISGEISCLVDSKLLKDQGKIISSFNFGPEGLKLPDIKLTSGEKHMTASIALKQKKDMFKLNTLLNFGESAPRFHLSSDVACLPIGELSLAGEFPHQKQVERVVAEIPLDKFALLVSARGLETRANFQSGTIRVAKETVNVDNVAVALPGRMSCTIEGTVGEITKSPLFRLNVKSKKLDVGQLVKMLPQKYQEQLGERRLFGTVDIEGIIEGKGTPEPTARLALAGLGCEMEVQGQKRQIVFKSGSLTLKRGRRLVLSGVDISLSGIIAKVAGNIVERDGKWEGEGRATVRRLSLPSLVPLLPGKMAPALSALSPEGYVTTQLRAQLDRGAPPSLSGSIELNGISLKMPKEAGGAPIKISHATIRLQDEEAYLEPCTIQLSDAALSAKGSVKSLFSQPTLLGDLQGKKLSLAALYSLFPAHVRQRLPLKSVEGKVDLLASAKTDKSGELDYQASLALQDIWLKVKAKDDVVKVSLPKGKFELDQNQLVAKYLLVRTMGHSFSPELSVALAGKEPVVDFKLPATLLKLSQAAPYLPSSVPAVVKKAVLENRLSAKAYVTAFAKGTMSRLTYGGKLTAQNFSYLLAKNQPAITVAKATCSFSPEGLTVAPFVVQAGEKISADVSFDEKKKLVTVVAKKLAVADLAAFAPRQYVGMVKRMAPGGRISTKAYIPLDNPDKPTILAKVAALSILLPLDGKGKRATLSAALQWRNNVLACKDGKLSLADLALAISDGKIVQKNEKDFIFDLALAGNVPLAKAVQLYPHLKEKVKDLSFQGEVEVRASAKGPLRGLQGQATLRPIGVGAELSHEGMTLSPKLSQGALQLYVATKGDELSAKAKITPELVLKLAGGELKLAGDAQSLTTAPHLELQLSSTPFRIIDLMARMPAELCAPLAAFSPQGTVSLQGEAKGSLQKLDGELLLTPKDFALTLPVPDKPMSATLQGGALKVKLYLREDKTVAHATLSPQLDFLCDKASIAVSGSCKDLTGKANCSLKALSSPLPISLVYAMSPAEFHDKLKQLGLGGTFKLSGTATGSLPHVEAKGTLLPQGLTLSPQGLPFKVKAKVLSGAIDVASKSKAEGASEASLRLSKSLRVEALGCVAAVTGSVKDLLGKPWMSLKVALEKAQISDVIKRLCDIAKINAPKAAAGLQGQPKKAVVSIKGTVEKADVSAWADLTGIKFVHPALASPATMTSGRLALKKAGGFLWKDLVVNVGPVAMKSNGEFNGTLAEGEFSKAYVNSSFALKDVPPLLKLADSLELTGKATIEGSIAGKLTSPMIEGSLAAPNKFTVKLKGDKKPFRVDLGDIKSKWAFDTKSGNLSFVDIEGMIAHGLIAGEAAIGVLTSPPVHTCEFLFADMNVDKFLRRGANIGGLVKGTFGLEFKGKLTGGLETLEGSGLTDIYDCELNGSKLITVAGFDKFLPKKDKSHKKLGNLLLQVATEGLLSESSGGQKLLRVRDVLHHRFGFGQVSGQIEAKDGKLVVAPVTSKEGKSSLSGSLKVGLADLTIDGRTSFRLVREPDVLTIKDLTVKGTLSAPEFDLPRGPLNSFKFRSLTKDANIKKPTSETNSVIIER